MTPLKKVRHVINPVMLIKSLTLLFNANMLLIYDSLASRIESSVLVMLYLHIFWIF